LVWNYSQFFLFQGFYLQYDDEVQVSKVKQNIVFFIVGNILGREWSTFSRIMRFAQFLYVEIQPQGCDNNPETSQFLIPFLSKTFTLFISGHLFIISAQL